MTKQRFFMLPWLLLAFSMATHAITRSNLVSYASSLNGKKKAELKTAVYNLINSPKTLTYGGKGANYTWWGFYKTDRVASTNECINRYSANKFYFGSSNTGTAISGMNIEHSFPKSWWGGSENSAYKDLYNLYPSDSKANSSKSNYPMGVVTSVTSEEKGYDKVGTGTIDGQSGVQCWEPGDQYKGDFSRAYMYMATCYQNLTWTGTQGLQELENDTWPTLKSWAYKLYLQWIEADPVDDLETARNNAVADIQGNRNLFVDFPYLAEYIWGDSVNVAFNPATSITTASDDNRYGNTSGGSTGGGGSDEGGEDSSLTGSGTQADPYTVADVLSLFEAGNQPSSEVYVKGIVSKIDELSTSYGNATYYISDDGTTNNQFYVFRGKYLENAKFTSNDQLQVADQVVVYGKLTAYTDKKTGITTNEFAQNNYLISVTRASAEGPVDPTATFATASKSLTVGGTFTQTVTTNSDGAVTYASSNTAVATVNSTSGLVTAVAAGTATITATIAATSNYNQATATYTVTVSEAVTPEPSGDNYAYVKVTSAPDSWDGQYLIVYEEGSVAMTGSGTTAATVKAPYTVTIKDNMIAATDATDANSVTIATDATAGYTIQTASGYYIYNTSATKNGFSANTSLTTAQKYAATLAYNTDDEGVDITSAGSYLRFNPTNSPNIFNYYKSETYSNQKPVALYRKTVVETALDPVAPTASFDKDNVEIYVGRTATQTVNTNSDGTVTYTSGTPAVATVDSETGEVTAVSEGTTVITASVAKTDSYLAASATYTVTVVPAPASTGSYYVKVTSEPTDWSGQYLIVNEDGLQALDGSRETLNAATGESNTFAVVITDDKIESTTETDGASFTIAKTDGGYSIQGASGGYIGLAKGKAGLDTNEEAVANTIAYDDENACTVVSCTSVLTTSGESSDITVTLQYNPNQGTPLVRYYQSTQKPIQLYRRVSTTLIGDVDKNHIVDTDDVVALAEYLLGKRDAADIDLDAADVDKDKSISLADITALVNILTKK